MKKRKWFLVLACVGTLSTTLAWAQTDQYTAPEAQPGAGQPGMGQPGAGQSGMMGRGMMTCPAHMVMALSLAQRQVTATEDGGALVLAGNQLFRYDKNMNLVNKTELPIDPAQIQKMLDQIKQNCPKNSQ